MKIFLNKIGKRYNKQWIFKDLSYTFESGNSYAIIGNNGSGKSTLLQSILGSIQLSIGTIDYLVSNKKLPLENAFQHISFAAPYLELIEEMTLNEMIHFHQKFKPFIDINLLEIVNILGLKDDLNKQIGNYSSGMKQRVKLGLAFFSNTKALMLDEPTSNLDEKGIQLYQNLIKNYSLNRTIIISSNDKNEYAFCPEKIIMEQTK